MDIWLPGKTNINEDKTSREGEQLNSLHSSTQSTRIAGMKPTSPSDEHSSFQLPE